MDGQFLMLVIMGVVPVAVAVIAFLFPEVFGGGKPLPESTVPSDLDIVTYRYPEHPPGEPPEPPQRARLAGR